MRNIHDQLEQIIDNLLLIKNHTDKFSSIEKDILLQNLREAYLLILQQSVLDKVQVVENQEETIFENQQALVGEEKPHDEMEIHEEEQNGEENEEENEEMDADILEFVKKPIVEEDVKLASEPEIKFEEPVVEEVMESEKKVEEKPIPEPEIETAVEVEQEEELKPEQEPESETPVDIEEISEQQEEAEIKAEVIAKEELMPEPEVEKEPELKTEPEPEVKEEEVAEPKKETVRKFAEILELEPEPEPHIQTETEKPQQRSLNDLFIEQKQDLGDKFQKTKIADLTKAMSINDKFLFIRELFKNKSEEFSRAIQTLNKCENIEEAFDIMEGLKKQYFWDSTSSAYLALCDLVRRKF